jgi:hypothetical protein
MNTHEAILNEQYREYREDLIRRFWIYQQERFQGKEELLERAFDLNNQNKQSRPPVFKRQYGRYNILIHESLSGKLRDDVSGIIPEEKWHRWFPSMTSSQALAQSVFGNLFVLGKLNCLASLTGDDAKPLFIRGTHYPGQLKMEHVIMYLGETARKTHVDVFLCGDFQVAVECKLSEKEAGPCSRPWLREDDPSYSEQCCNGNYMKQRDRKERCALTEIKVKYWEHLPKFFTWDPNKDHCPCPLNETYQLVRNVLAASLKASADNEDGENAEGADGHAVLIYDERNPEFLKGGKGWLAWEKTKEGLKKGKESLLQKCTWQQIISAMKRDPELSWLVDMLHEKYGF